MNVLQGVALQRAKARGDILDFSDASLPDRPRVRVQLDARTGRVYEAGEIQAFVEGLLAASSQRV